MATSSIFANFDIHDSEKAEAFVHALELSEQDKQAHPNESLPHCEYVTDSKRLDELFAERIKKYGISKQNS